MEEPKLENPLEWLYGEIKKLARMLLRRERAGHTLTPTDLTHMALMQLLNRMPEYANDRKGFLLLVMTVMRRLLVDYARAYKARKRPGSQQRVEFDENLVFSDQTADLILQVNEALERLCEQNDTRCKVVQLHFFSGHTFAEIAEILNISERHAKRHWMLARLELRDMLDGGLSFVTE